MRNHIFKIVGIALLPGFLACAHGQPSEELLKARQAYSTAEAGPATQLDPADLHEARVALDNAESISSNDPQSFNAKQASYLALRRAEMADAQGKTAAAMKSRDDYAMQERQMKDALLAKTQSQLAATTQQNAAVQGQLAMTTDQLNAERDARMAAEKSAADALAKLGAVKNDERGLVLTLSGSVVFASNKAVLLPSAQRRLDDVANALRDSPRGIRIEGHTDSRGSDTLNQDLSQRRAEAVMSYLISQNIPATRISAIGLGSSKPVADNKTAEGRANNRRVEIILLKDTQVSANR